MCIQGFHVPGLETYVILFNPHSMFSEESCYYYSCFPKEQLRLTKKWNDLSKAARMLNGKANSEQF